MLADAGVLPYARCMLGTGIVRMAKPCLQQRFASLQVSRSLALASHTLALAPPPDVPSTAL